MGPTIGKAVAQSCCSQQFPPPPVEGVGYNEAGQNFCCKCYQASTPGKIAHAWCRDGSIDGTTDCMTGPVCKWCPHPDGGADDPGPLVKADEEETFWLADANSRLVFAEDMSVPIQPMDCAQNRDTRGIRVRWSVRLGASPPPRPVLPCPAASSCSRWRTARPGGWSGGVSRSPTESRGELASRCVPLRPAVAASDRLALDSPSGRRAAGMRPARNWPAPAGDRSGATG